MNLEQIVKETVAKIVAEKKGKDLTGDGKIDSADYLKARDMAIKKAQGKEIDEARVSQDNVVDYLANVLDHVWGMGKGNNPIDFQDIAQSIYFDIFGDDEMNEARFKKGEDVGGKGFEFKDIAKKAAKQYGSKEAGQRVAGAIMKKILNKEGEDHEVAMAQSSLESIIRSAMELKAKIGDQEIDIPAWIQDHITNSENYIEQASQGYHEYENGGHEEMNEEYNFEQSAIESASGDTISHVEEDDYGRGVYWSASDPNISYYLGSGGEYEGNIYKYNSETGKTEMIGHLDHYGAGQNHSVDDDMHEQQELNEFMIRRWQHYAGIK